MPAIIEDDASSDITENENDNVPAELPFPPVTKKHIMNCSYHSWHPKYVCRPELSCFLKNKKGEKMSNNLALPDTAPSRPKHASSPSLALSSTTCAPTA